jgi:hypothetical protein
MSSALKGPFEDRLSRLNEPFRLDPLLPSVAVPSPSPGLRPGLKETAFQAEEPEVIPMGDKGSLAAAF